MQLILSRWHILAWLGGTQLHIFALSHYLNDEYWPDFGNQLTDNGTIKCNVHGCIIWMAHIETPGHLHSGAGLANITPLHHYTNQHLHNYTITPTNICTCWRYNIITLTPHNGTWVWDNILWSQSMYERGHTTQWDLSLAQYTVKPSALAQYAS